MLHTTTTASTGSLVVFCHGLFGQGRNWTGVAKALSDRAPRAARRPAAARPLGPWSDPSTTSRSPTRWPRCSPPTTRSRWSGTRWAARSPWCWPCRSPELVQRLCVVDIAPVDYGGSSEFSRYVEAMQGLDLWTRSTARRRRPGAVRRGARPDRARLPAAEPAARRTRRWRWQANLEVLGAELDEISGWPEEQLEGTAPYDGPVLWIAGDDVRLRPPRERRGHAALVPAAPARSSSRAPATGCTPSSPRCSSRCCGASRPSRCYNAS